MSPTETKVRAISATSWGILDCPRKYVYETYLDMLTAAGEYRLRRGRLAHEAFGKVNAQLKATGSVSEEEARAFAMGVGLEFPDHVQLAEGLVWWAMKMDGVQPVAVEEDGGRFEFIAGGLTWKGKMDAVIFGEKGLVIPEGKWSFIPWEEERARWLVQNLIYGDRGTELFQQTNVTILMVSLTGKRTTPVSYTRADLDAYRQCMDHDAARVNALHVKIAGATGAGALEKLVEEDQDFAPRMCGWCKGCPVRATCRMFKSVLSDPLKAVGTTNRHEAYKRMGLASSILASARKDVKEDLHADVEAAGPEGVVEDGWRAVLKPVEKEAYTVAAHTEHWLTVQAPGQWSKDENKPAPAKKGKKGVGG